MINSNGITLSMAGLASPEQFPEHCVEIALVLLVNSRQQQKSYCMPLQNGGLSVIMVSGV